MHERHPERRAKIVLLALLALALISMAAFMTLGAKGSWSFVLPFRGIKLLSLLLVAYAIAVSTVLFQTVTNNRILTPSVMGFDSLYVLMQTGLIFVFGSATVVMIDPQLKFLAETALLVGFSALLYRWLFIGAERSLHLLVLVGIVFGVFFRSLSGFMQRVLDPNEYTVLQDVLFASFNSIDPTLLTVSAIIIGVVTIIGFR
ncbi:iron chelate uptake ABC transporter family permease subunit, partial [Rhizobium sp.]|uniref:iron chelate uptake ABC transporter family permease subunit n=1 Tax=Rhizobium sp. TaxID=391 RepID=UPI0028AFFBE7